MKSGKKIKNTSKVFLFPTSLIAIRIDILMVHGGIRENEWHLHNFHGNVGVKTELGFTLFEFPANGFAIGVETWRKHLTRCNAQFVPLVPRFDTEVF